MDADFEMWRQELMGPNEGILTNSQRRNTINLSTLNHRIDHPEMYTDLPNFTNDYQPKHGEAE